MNTDHKFVNTTLKIESMGDAALRMPFEDRALKITAGTWSETFAPYEEKVYLVGPEPQD